MILFRKLIIAAGKKYRGNVFTIDEAIPLSSVARFGMSRSMMALRGLIKRPRFHSHSNWPFFLGRGARILTPSNVRVGKGATIGKAVVIEGLSREGVTLGPGTSIGDYTIIMPTSVMRSIGVGFSMGSNSGIGQFSFIGCGGGVSIGSNVIMGQYVSFHTENHNFEDSDVPIVHQGTVRQRIVIEDDCWIGAKATFLSGAHVERGCVVAAGSVVRGRIPPYSVIGGVPAKILKTRQRR